MNSLELYHRHICVSSLQSQVFRHHPMNLTRQLQKRGNVVAGRGRLWQLEFVRGIAVVIMIFYHFMWDLAAVGLYPNDVTVGGWRLFQQTWATVFVLLVGVSVAFAGERRQGARRNAAWYRRGGQLLAFALAISVVTRFVLGDAFILFGILHLVGTATLLAPLMWRGRKIAPFVGAVVVWLGTIFTQTTVDTWWFIPLGLYPDDYPAVDYFPLVPWLGVVMLGLGAGRLLLLRLPERAPAGTQAPRLLQPIVTLGRHSLLIYVIHQPILLAGLWAFGYTFW